MLASLKCSSATVCLCIWPEQVAADRRPVVNSSNFDFSLNYPLHNLPLALLYLVPSGPAAAYLYLFFPLSSTCIQEDFKYRTKWERREGEIKLNCSSDSPCSWLCVEWSKSFFRSKGRSFSSQQQQHRQKLWGQVHHHQHQHQQHQRPWTGLSCQVSTLYLGHLQEQSWKWFFLLSFSLKGEDLQVSFLPCTSSPVEMCTMARPLGAILKFKCEK